MGSWEDTFTEQLGADIFIEQQHMATAPFDLSLAIWQDRRLDDLNTFMMDEVEGQEGGAVG